MRKLLLIGLTLVVLTAGCKKTSKGAKTTGSSDSATASSEGPPVHAPSGVVLNPNLGGGGGGGGAVGAVRNRVLREVTHNEMKNIHLIIETASGASGQMPGMEEINAVLQKEAPKTWKLVQDKAIVLTGTRSRENIWAYTPEQQGSAGHFIVSSSGVDNIPKQELDRRLAQQRGQ
jgi:hypothetical protein